MDLQSLIKYGKIIIFITMMTAMISPMITAATTKINASDDSYVVSGPYANQNYNSGDAQNLIIGYSRWNYPARSYLKFDLSSLQGKSFLSGNLSLYFNVLNGNPTAKLYYVSNNSWNENTITWNNKPAYSTLLSSKIINYPSGRLYFNLDPSVLNNTNLSLVLIEDGENYPDYVQFFSKEDINRNSPYLEVTYEDGTSCNTQADTNCNSCVSMSELNNFISLWRTNPINLMVELNKAIYEWRKNPLCP